MEQEVIVGLDIGTTKVSAVIGEKNEHNEFIVLGVGKAPSYGIRKGVIVNIDSTTEAITKAIEEAELMAGLTVNSLYVSITGNHIDSKNSRGVIANSNRNREITDREIDRVIDAAQTINFPVDREIIHVIPWEFIVDDQDGVKDPVGMTGLRFEVNAHVVTASSTAMQNMTKSITRAGFKINNIVLSSIASAESVLTEEEKEIGILLVDIGGGTTDALLCYNGSTRYSNIFPIGGKHITKDISVGLKVPDNVAEQIKLEYKLQRVPTEGIEIEDMEIQIPSIGGRQARSIMKETVTNIVEPRIEEIISLVYKDALKKGILELIGGGVVLTGGSSLISGIDTITENIFNLPVRIGFPNLSAGLKDKIHSPIYSTASGLIMYGLKDENAESNHQYKSGFFKRVGHSISEFTKELFN